MKVSLTISDFPMAVYDDFVKRLRPYVDANIQVGGGDTVFVTFEADVVHAQEAIIICDLYAFNEKSPR